MANTNHNISHIRAICKALSKAELRMAGKYILLFESASSHSSATFSKSKKLSSKGGLSYRFFYLISTFDQKKSKISLDEQIKRNFTPTQIRNLGSRVLKKVHDFLLFELNIRRSTSESRNVALQYLQRNISLLEFLLVRRVFLHFEEHAKKLLEIAIKFELYNEACSIIRLQLSLQINRVTIKEFDKIIDRYNIYNLKAEAINKINLFAYSLQVRFNRKIKNTEIIDYLNQSLPDLYRIEKGIDSDTWNLAFSKILLEYYHQMADFKSADKVCFKQLEIYERSKFLSAKNRIGGTYLQLANNNLFDQNFKQSLSYIDYSITYFKKGFLNYVNACDVKFYNLIYLRKYDKALELTNEILEFNSVQSDKFYLAKWEYFKTICLYYQGKLKDAFVNLSASQEISQDKEGWGINIRLLSIIIQIDRKLYEGVEFELETLRKQLLKLKAVVPYRYFLIQRTLTFLVKKDFAVNKQDIESNVNYQKLISNDSNHWKVKTPELVKFENWLAKF
jgi:hypothetical protein